MDYTETLTEKVPARSLVNGEVVCEVIEDLKDLLDEVHHLSENHYTRARHGFVKP